MTDPKKTYQVPMDTATIDQLRWHAQNQMGIEISQTMNKHVLKTKIIQAGWEHDYLVYAPDTPEIATDRLTAKKESQPEAVGDVEVPEPTVVVLIPVSERPGGKDAVFLAVNGVGIWVKRATRSRIKYRYFLQLQGAVETNYHQEEDLRGRPGPLLPSEMPLYPHTVIEHPPQDVVDAWLKWDADQSNARSQAVLAERRKNPQPTIVMMG